MPIIIFFTFIFSIIGYLIMTYIISSDVPEVSGWYYVGDFVLTIVLFAIIGNIKNIIENFFIFALIIVSLIIIYLFSSYWLESLLLSITYIFQVIYTDGITKFITQDIQSSLFPLRFASFIITFQLIMFFKTLYSNKNQFLDSNLIKLLSFYTIFQYIFYLLILIVLWETNNIENIPETYFNIMNILNWAILFIIDDFSIIYYYAIHLKVKPLYWHKIKIFIFNIMIFIGIIFLLNFNNFDNTLYWLFIFISISILVMSFQIKKFSIKSTVISNKLLEEEVKSTNITSV